LNNEPRSTTSSLASAPMISAGYSKSPSTAAVLSDLHTILESTHQDIWAWSIQVQPCPRSWRAIWRISFKSLWSRSSNWRASPGSFTVVEERSCHCSHKLSGVYKDHFQGPFRVDKRAFPGSLQSWQRASRYSLNLLSTDKKVKGPS
jgi:hypothetical protein